MLFSVLKGGEYSLWTYSVRDRKASPFGDVRSSIPTDAGFSADGRWVAYSGGPFADASILVQPFPSTGAKYELPRSGRGVPHHPLWSPDGTLVFNQRAGYVDVVSVATSPTPAFGKTVSAPRKFQTGPPSVRRAFDAMPDGRLVGLIVPGDPEDISTFRQFNVVLNWFDELKARVPAR